MNEPFSITPPPELVEQWANDSVPMKANAIGKDWEIAFASRAAQWGADAELNYCCDELSFWGSKGMAERLRSDRRPKPPSLNSIALQMLGTIERDARYIPEITDTIRRALESLND
jgi:hypothetical protein